MNAVEGLIGMEIMGHAHDTPLPQRIIDLDR